MTEQETCGQGLAENAVLPKTLGEAIASMADVLEAHMPSLDLKDPDARPEYDAYASLVAQQRRIAEQLQAVADEMAGYADLPMGRHDPALMASRRVAEAFRQFVEAEKAALALLEQRVAGDDAMLSEIEG